MVQHGQSHDRPIPVAAKTTRRAVVGWTAKLTAGALTAAIPTRHLVLTARADDEVILIADGAQVSARPGSATARSAAAEAVAARGAARVQAAAALAEADSDQGAIAQGAAASAVASASSEDERAEAPQAAPRVVAPAAPSGGGRRARGGGGRRVRGDGGRVRGGHRAARAAVGGQRVRLRDRAASLPSTGVGQLDSNALPSFFTIASAVATLGAVVLRDRSETAQVAEVGTSNA